MKEQIKEMYGDVRNAIVHNSAVDFSRGCILAVDFDGVTRELYDDGYRKQNEGEWIDKPTGAYGRMQSWCSACGKHSGIGGIESNRHKPYCPNCGAKMKGADNE